MRNRVPTDPFAGGVRERLFGEEFDHDQAIALLVGPLIFAVITGEVALSTKSADAALHAFMAGQAS